MRFRTVLLIVGIAIIIILLVINRGVLATQIPWNFGFASESVSAGMLIVGFIVAITFIFGLYILLSQGAMLMDYRRQAKELQSQRLLAEDAEASRFSALRDSFRDELTKLATHIDSSLETLNGNLQDVHNSVAATVGELDDRLQRTSVVRNNVVG